MRLSLHRRTCRNSQEARHLTHVSRGSILPLRVLVNYRDLLREVSIPRAVADLSRALPEGDAASGALTCTRGSTASSRWSGSSALSFCTHPLIIRSRGGILFTALHATCVCIVCYISGGHVGYQTYDHGAGQDRHMPRCEGARECREVCRESFVARSSKRYRAITERGSAIVPAPWESYQWIHFVVAK